MQVLVTGATGGIGFEIASQFASAGHSVILADLQLAQAEQKAAQLSAQGFNACGIQLDVTNETDIARCTSRFDIDVLINNAGIQHVARLEDFPPLKWQQLITVMLTGPAMLSRAVLPGGWPAKSAIF